MFRRLWALVSSAAVVLLTRWGLRIARPQDDVQAVRQAWWEVSDRVQGVWLVLWRLHGPITAEMRAKWAELRARYTTGAYGIEGT